MEEQKKNKTLNIVNNNKEEKRKLTYEQLNEACNQLFQQNRQLSMKNRELEQFLINKRMEYLFKVVESSSIFHSDFVGNCIDEIEEAMKIPQNTEAEKGE